MMSLSLDLSDVPTPDVVKIDGSEEIAPSSSRLRKKVSYV